MTRSKSWARRRAAQVLRAARLPVLAGSIPDSIMLTSDEMLSRTLLRLKWGTWGGGIWSGGAVSLRCQRVSAALDQIIDMAGLDA